MGRKTITLIAAFVIAALGASLIFLYVRGLEDKAEIAAVPVEVLTVTANIKAGESVKEASEAGKFELSEVPQDALLSGAETSTDEIADQVALAPLYTGEQVIGSKFGETGSTTAITIPAKAIAVSVELSDPQRVAGFVAPGSDVAIFTTVGVDSSTQAGCPDGAVGGQPSTRLLLPKAPVVGIGATGINAPEPALADAPVDPAAEQVSTTLLTVGLDQRDSEKLILAAQTSCLSLGLRTEASTVALSAGTPYTALFGGN